MERDTAAALGWGTVAFSGPGVTAHLPVSRSTCALRLMPHAPAQSSIRPRAGRNSRPAGMAERASSSRTTPSSPSVAAWLWLGLWRPSTSLRRHHRVADFSMVPEPRKNPSREKTTDVSTSFAASRPRRAEPPSPARATRYQRAGSLRIGDMRSICIVAPCPAFNADSVKAPARTVSGHRRR